MQWQVCFPTLRQYCSLSKVSIDFKKPVVLDESSCTWPFSLTKTEKYDKIVPCVTCATFYTVVSSHVSVSNHLIVIARAPHPDTAMYFTCPPPSMSPVRGSVASPTNSPSITLEFVWKIEQRIPIDKVDKMLPCVVFYPSVKVQRLKRGFLIFYPNSV